MLHKKMVDVTVIGAAVADVLAAPASKEVFETGSMPMENIRLSFGGDALNEAVVLSKLGFRVQLISKVGNDEAGRRILSYMEENGLSTDSVCVEDNLETAVNIVLVDGAGERHFLTNPKSSLRRLALADILPHLNKSADIVSFAGMFVSPLLTIENMEKLFARIHADGHILLADMTTAKNNEKLGDIRRLLSYADVVTPNETEAALLTGEADPLKNVQHFLDAGAKTAVIKTGNTGCVVGEHIAQCTDEKSIQNTYENNAQNKHDAERAQNAENAQDQQGVQSVQSSRNAQYICRIYCVPAVPGITCTDSTGAGDAFAAGFLAGLCRKLSAKECALLGNAAASCAVECIGATEGVTSAEKVFARFRRLSDEREQHQPSVTDCA